MRRLLLLLCLSAPSSTAIASEPHELLLSDGTLIRGELLSFDGRRYTVRSATLGTLRIDGSDVESITLQGTGGVGTHALSAQALLGAQRAMLADPEIVAVVQALRDDPTLQELLQDPALLQALSSGDVEALLSDPRIQTLAEHPAVQEIRSRMTAPSPPR